jgi:tetratricopeptide (TPR) repeat protein
LLLAALGLVTALAAGDGAAALAEADAHFARRAEGMHGAVADPAPVEAAIAAYRRALALDRDALPPRVGLLRALFFRAGFCGQSASANKATYEEAKRFAENSIDRVEATLKGDKAARFEALRRIPEAAALYFWAGVSWGQWSLDHKLAAAWQGAAGKIRDYAETAIALDPGYELGSPYVLLGRLHVDSPKLPFVTGFVSRKKGLESLRRALEIAPQNTVAEYFLAVAMLDYEPESKDDAIRMLEACAHALARPDYLAEDAHYAELAQRRLTELAKP